MDRITEFTSTIGELLEQSLGIDTGQILLQWIATFVLFFVVFRYLWKPLTNILEERQAIVEGDLRKAQELSAKAEDVKAEIDVQLTKARQQAKDMLEAARTRSLTEREQLIADTEAELARLRAKAEAELSQDVVKAREELKDEVVEIAFLVAEKILQQQVEKNMDASTFADVLKQVNHDKS
jgi:F-type H+-transporting ATPase subunit b